MKKLTLNTSTVSEMLTREQLANNFCSEVASGVETIGE